MLNAFCRVAPSLRFSVFAIFFAGTFFLASDFSSRTLLMSRRVSSLIHFSYESVLQYMGRVLLAISGQKKSPPVALPSPVEGAAGKERGILEW